MSKKKPELPPGYAYVHEGERIFISYTETNTTLTYSLRENGQRKYWMRIELAALAAWKHAYEQISKQAQTIGRKNNGI